MLEEIQEMKSYNQRYGDIYREYQNKYCKNLKGDNTKRIVDYIFKSEGSLTPITCYAETKSIF